MVGGVPAGRRRVVLLLGASLVAALIAATALVFLAADRPPRAARPNPTTTGAPGPTEVYASDGTTLVARFDAEPGEACARVPANDLAFFCDYLSTWWLAESAFGADAAQRLDRLRGGGYRIVSSIDAPLQAAAKRHVEAQLPTGDPRLLSVVTVEPGTGRIRAMATNRTFQRAPASASASADPFPARSAPPRFGSRYPGTDEPVLTGSGNFDGYQAGTTFMMFTAATALDRGIPLSHAVDTKPRYESQYRVNPSGPLACGKARWCPTNVGDRAYRSGRRTMWEALSHSVITYFVPVQEQIGADNVVAMAQRLGIRFGADSDRTIAASASARDWGAFTLGVSATTPLDLANAYAILAADGRRCDPLPVLRITDAGGRPVAGVGPRCWQAVRAEVARAAMDAARCGVGDRSASGDVCGAGKAPAAAVRGVVDRPVAGQLGFDAEGSGSAIAVANPQLSTAAIGTDPRCLCPSLGAGGAATLVATAAGTMRDGLAPLPSADFPAPPPELVRGG